MATGERKRATGPEAAWKRFSGPEMPVLRNNPPDPSANANEEGGTDANSKFHCVRRDHPRASQPIESASVKRGSPDNKRVEALRSTSRGEPPTEIRGVHRPRGAGMFWIVPATA